MPTYTISFYNDMGHLLTSPNYSKIPEPIYDFVYEKIKNKLLYATDTKNVGCRFYILKPELLNKWTYSFHGDYIKVDYSKLDTFNPNAMRYI